MHVSILISRRIARVALAGAMALAACTPHDGPAHATQVAARVNGAEITVHQVNFLQANPGSADASMPASEPAEGRHALDRLIDQELLVQAAIAHKLDRNPEILAAMEAARRNVLARAYLDQAGGAEPPVDAADIRAYFDGHAELFAERRVYQVREIRVDSDPAQHAAWVRQWSSLHNWNELADAAQASGASQTIGTRTIAAEQLPLDEVQEFQKFAVGAIRIARIGDTTAIQQVTKITREPMNREQAAPLIAAYLRAERRQDRAQEALAMLKKDAQIERVGEFDAAAAGAVPAGTVGTRPASSPTQ